MIRALDMVQDVQLAAGVRKVSTINATSDLQTLRILQELNYIGAALAQYVSQKAFEARWVFRTLAEVTDGDCDVTQGSPFVTSDNASTDWDETLEGRAFKTAGYEEIYRVREVTSSTTLTLETAFNGSTATDQSYTIAEDEYLLPYDYDDTISLNVLQFVTPANLDLVPSEEFDRRRFASHGQLIATTSQLVTDDPEIATIRGVKDGRYVMVLHPFPKDAIQIVFNYFRTVTDWKRDNDVWPFPNRFRLILREWALSHFRKNHQDDGRSQVELQEFLADRAELLGISGPMDNRPHFIPDTGERRLRRSRRRVNSAAYDLGSFFDRT